MNDPGGPDEPRERDKGGSSSSSPPRPGSLNASHLYEPPERDRAVGPDGDIQAEINRQRYGWGEDWDYDA